MSLIILITSALGAFTTYKLHNSQKLDVVTASVLPSLVVALFCKFLFVVTSANILVKIPIVFFGATFAGMSAKTRLKTDFSVVFSKLVFGFIYLFFSKTFTGFGGGLGTTAAISVLTSITI